MIRMGGTTIEPLHALQTNQQVSGEDHSIHICQTHEYYKPNGISLIKGWITAHDTLAKRGGDHCKE